MSFAEWKVLERLQARPIDVAFVLESVGGVLSGHPVSPSWQQRFLGPLFVAGIDTLTHDRSRTLALFGALTLLASNLLLFGILRRRGAGLAGGALAVTCFVCARLLLAFRLEYPWDGIDVLLFLLFGAQAARRARPLAAVPLFLIGLFNHETALWLPLWFLLAPLERPRRSRMQVTSAALAFAVGAGVILALRRTFYRGRPDLPSQVFETVTPVIDNHLHLSHNLGTLFVSNWHSGLASVSLGLLGVLALLIRAAIRGPERRAATWTLAAVSSIFLFGYTNETRHYLPLLAFWFAYRMPPLEPVGDASSPGLSSDR
jgi:hypothetical protein